MKVEVNMWRGEWYDKTFTVVRVTKTMIIVQWGNGTRRFNRTTGRATGATRFGLSGMTSPFISAEALQKFEREPTKA